MKIICDRHGRTSCEAFYTAAFSSQRQVSDGNDLTYIEASAKFIRAFQQRFSELCQADGVEISEDKDEIGLAEQSQILPNALSIPLPLGAGK